jgi:hypothetical protein
VWVSKISDAFTPARGINPHPGPFCFAEGVTTLVSQGLLYRSSANFERIVVRAKNHYRQS